VSSLLISGFWHERSTAAFINAQSNTRLKSKGRAHASPPAPQKTTFAYAPWTKYARANAGEL